MNKIKWSFKQLKKAIDYAIFSWHDRDYDDWYLDDIVLFKLKRLLKDMEAFPYIDWTDKTDKSIKSLKCAIGILEKVQNDYFDYPMDRHDKKWGELNLHTMPSDREGYYEIKFSRAKATTPGLKKREQEQSGKAFNRGLRLKEKYTNIVYKIIMKHKQTWWT